MLTDVRHIGEWSHECLTAKWLDGADQAAVGARFRGTSKARFAPWSRPCTITALDTDRCFIYRTDGGIQRDATEWTFTLEPTDDGCRITPVRRWWVSSMRAARAVGAESVVVAEA